MLRRRSNVSVAIRAFAWVFALAIALGAPEASVLCESSDGHLAVERAHVRGVCFAEAVRHAVGADAVSGSDAPSCADTLLDRSLVRQEDSPNGSRVPSLPGVASVAAFREPEATFAAFDALGGDGRTRLRHTLLQRTIQLQL
jgi:hypothetical protein